MRLALGWSANRPQPGNLHQEDRQQEIDKTLHFLSLRFHCIFAALEEQARVGYDFQCITTVVLGIRSIKLNIPIFVPICTPSHISGEEFRNTTPISCN
jgi:hypothetical protein